MNKLANLVLDLLLLKSLKKLSRSFSRESSKESSEDSDEVSPGHVKTQRAKLVKQQNSQKTLGIEQPAHGVTQFQECREDGQFASYRIQSQKKF